MDTLIRWAIYAAIAASIMAAIYWAWNTYVLDPAVARGHALGVAETTAKYQPQVDDLTKKLRAAEAANADIGNKLAVIQRDFDSFRSYSNNAVAAGAAALAAERARAKLAVADVQKFAAIVNRPPSAEPKEIVCERANAIADDLIRGTLH